MEATNTALDQVGAGFLLSPEKNVLSDQEKRATTIGYYPEQANGYGLLNTGAGTPDKVFIRNGRLVGRNCGTMYALVSIAGRTYHIKGNTLIK